jgi:hypothetical protein
MVIRFALTHVAHRGLCPEGSMPGVIPSLSGRPRFRLQAHVGPFIRHSREACPAKAGSGNPRVAEDVGSRAVALLFTWTRYEAAYLDVGEAAVSPASGSDTVRALYRWLA